VPHREAQYIFLTLSCCSNIAQLASQIWHSTIQMSNDLHYCALFCTTLYYLSISKQLSSGQWHTCCLHRSSNLHHWQGWLSIGFLFSFCCISRILWHSLSAVRCSVGHGFFKCCMHALVVKQAMLHMWMASGCSAGAASWSARSCSRNDSSHAIGVKTEISTDLPSSNINHA